MDPVEKVFSIDDLRLLILSFYIDKKKVKIHNSSCKSKLHEIFCSPIDRLVFYILIRIYYSR